jgi:cell wall-associated NlpC family hydrolase
MYWVDTRRRIGAGLAAAAAAHDDHQLLVGEVVVLRTRCWPSARCNFMRFMWRPRELLTGAVIAAGLLAMGVSADATTPIRAPAPGASSAPASPEPAAGSGTPGGTGTPAAPNPPGASPAPDGRLHARIDVSVATLWMHPHATRALDRPSLERPVAIRTWLARMGAAERRWLVGRLVTQALYGQDVVVRRRQGGWDQVSLTGQARGGGLSYPGWLPERQLSFRPRAAIAAPATVAVVRTPTAWLRTPGAGDAPGARFLQISFDTQLPVVGRRAGFVSVGTPDGATREIAAGAVWLRPVGALVPTPSGKQIVSTARQFLGLRYLWAGTSGFGFDCSGLTSAVYAASGIVIPRTADLQAGVGWPVARSRLAPGDLVFFSPGGGGIDHVAIYVGHGRILESPNSSFSVRVIPLSLRSGQYVAARRMLGPTPR